MSEFKGTKRKWTYEYDGDGMRFCEISCFIDDTYENYKEDALLISKAPEMLEMLERILKEGVIPHLDVAELIKEATEL